MQLELMFDSFRAARMERAQPSVPTVPSVVPASQTKDLAAAYPQALQGLFEGRARREFYQPIIAEISFPKLDAGSKDAATMTIKLQPEPAPSSASVPSLHQHNQTDLEFLLRRSSR